MCTAVATVCVGERSLCIPLMSIHVCATMLSLESHSDIFKDTLPGDHGLPCDLASQPQGVGISRIIIPCTFPILPPTPDLLGTGCVCGGVFLRIRGRPACTKSKKVVAHCPLLALNKNPGTFLHPSFTQNVLETWYLNNHGGQGGWGGSQLPLIHTCYPQYHSIDGAHRQRTPITRNLA